MCVFVLSFLMVVESQPVCRVESCISKHNICVVCSAVVSINVGNTRLVCSAVLWFLLMPETQDLFCVVCGAVVSMETGNTRLVSCFVKCCGFY